MDTKTPKTPQRTGRARERRDAARRVYEQTIEGIAASGELHDLLPAWTKYAIIGVPPPKAEPK